VTADAAVDVSVGAADGEVVGGTETILLAEDEPSLRVAARRVLRKHGYTVLTAADGVEALEIFRARRGEIDMVVSDVIMPRLGGIELLRELRKEPSPVKVLLTSGYALQLSDGLPSSERAPVLTKPWTVPGLLRGIRDVLDGRVDTTA
jgi:two-component system cell cycle sensor histidine kinase/response regulator CckA